MGQQTRSLFYLALALALAGIFLIGGEAWARPVANMESQTVPTKTPRPTLTPPTAPSPTVPPGQTPAPGVTPVAPSGGVLNLTMTTGQLAIWPGMTATFTVTATNSGSASLREVTIENALPQGLEPGVVVTGAGAAWNGRVLRASVPVLAPGGVFAVVYTARVRADIASDATLVNRAVATTADGQQVAASVVLGQPPLELPTTGGAVAGEAGQR